MVGPGRQVMVHQIVEALVVARFKQMNHFVDKDVFQTFRGLFGEFGVETEGAAGGSAATPARLHMAHRETHHFDTQNRFPSGNEGRDGFFEQVAIPIGGYL